MYNTTWNIFAIFMGECLFDANKITSSAFKLLVGLCLFYFFLMCAAYGGILKGFLTSPILSKQIKTPQDVSIHFYDSFKFNFSLKKPHHIITLRLSEVVKDHANMIGIILWR